MLETIELRKNWVWSTLEECVEILDKKRIPVNKTERLKRIEGRKESELVPYYGATGQVGWIDDFIFNEELVLLGEDGAPFLDPLKDVAYIIRGKSWVNNHAHVLKAIESIITNQYLCYYLNKFDFREYVTGTTRLKLNQSMMRKIPIPIPPLSEQVRIVGRVEELFSRLDAGVRGLQSAQTQLEQYRQTALKQAYAGKYPYVNLGEIIFPSKERFDPIKGQNTAYIGLADIDQHTGKILNKGTSSETKSTKSVFHKGDLLYGRLRPYLNKVAVPDFDGVCSTDILVFPQNEQFNSNYLQQVLLSHDFVDYATKNMSGVQHPRIKYDEISKYKIPFPNIRIQNQIANKIIVVFSRIYKIIQILDDINIQSNKLKQSILKMAFEGRLVAQNPNDEPANALLERIKNERLTKGC